MISTFLDTSFFMALVLEDDALRSRAHAWHKALRGPFVTTEFVLVELGNSLSKPHLRATSQQIISFARDQTSIAVVPASPDWFERGYQLFQDRPDKAWSLTDCISFEVMRDMAITDALTHDHHFEQAGFRALLREDPPGN